MARDDLIRGTPGQRRSIAILALTAIILPLSWWLTGNEPIAAERGIIVVPAGRAVPALPVAAPSLPASGPASPIVAAPNFVVLETETADDAGAGSATIALPSGRVMRTAIGSWASQRARLVSVSDTDATFEVDGRLLAMPVTSGVAKPTGAESGLPGIDFNAEPNKANPAIARP